MLARVQAALLMSTVLYASRSPASRHHFESHRPKHAKYQYVQPVRVDPGTCPGMFCSETSAGLTLTDASGGLALGGAAGLTQLRRARRVVAAHAGAAAARRPPATPLLVLERHDNRDTRRS